MPGGLGDILNLIRYFSTGRQEDQLKNLLTQSELARSPGVRQLAFSSPDQAQRIGQYLQLPMGQQDMPPDMQGLPSPSVGFQVPQFGQYDPEMQGKLADIFAQVGQREAGSQLDTQRANIQRWILGLPPLPDQQPSGFFGGSPSSSLGTHHQGPAAAPLPPTEAPAPRKVGQPMQGPAGTQLLGLDTNGNVRFGFPEPLRLKKGTLGEGNQPIQGGDVVSNRPALIEPDTSKGAISRDNQLRRVEAAKRVLELNFGAKGKPSEALDLLPAAQSGIGGIPDPTSGLVRTIPGVNQLTTAGNFPLPGLGKSIPKMAREGNPGAQALTTNSASRANIVRAFGDVGNIAVQEQAFLDPLIIGQTWNREAGYSMRDHLLDLLDRIQQGLTSNQLSPEQAQQLWVQGLSEAKGEGGAPGGETSTTGTTTTTTPGMTTTSTLPPTNSGMGASDVQPSIDFLTEKFGGRKPKPAPANPGRRVGGG